MKQFKVSLQRSTANGYSIARVWITGGSLWHAPAPAEPSLRACFCYSAVTRQATHTAALLYISLYPILFHDYSSRYDERWAKYVFVVGQFSLSWHSHQCNLSLEVDKHCGIRKVLAALKRDGLPLS